MHELFEKFIGRCLKRALGSARVRLQDRRYSALIDMVDGERKPLFQLQPDAVIETSSGATGLPIVLDTKWKELTPGKPRCERTLGVEQSDVYQMLAYARAYGAERLILLYPWPNALGREEILRTWIVAESADQPAGATASMEKEDAPGREGAPCRLDIAVVDVGHPDAVTGALRTIVDSGAPS